LTLRISRDSSRNRKPAIFAISPKAKSGTRLLALRGIRDFVRDRGLSGKIRVRADKIVLRATQGIPDNLHHSLCRASSSAKGRNSRAPSPTQGECSKISPRTEMKLL
jgi:hypothetical protein